MRRAFGFTIFCACVITAPSVIAQPPGGGRPRASQGETTGTLVERMMAFDGNKDDQLTKSEVTDARLKRLFDQADADKDGLVTRGELNALMVRERASARGRSATGPGAGGMRRGFGGGPGGFGGGPGGRFGGGPGGFGGPGGPPRPGQILPPMLRERLSLTPEQEKQVDALQKDVDAKLGQILTVEQRQLVKEMSERGPGRPGFGGPGRFGGPPGGPPPGDGPPPN